MIHLSISFLALSSLISAAETHQQLLSKSDKDTSFIESSIFAKSPDILSLKTPVTLPPSFYPRELDEFPSGGFGTFAHLDFTECTDTGNSGTFDIGIVGHPFDLGVSYRPGARFGPNGARQGARRMSPSSGWE